jgi:seryl-tRNA synthetase
MLDLADFVSDRGGDPNKIKESQRKRFAPENVVDEVITLYEEARRGILLPQAALPIRTANLF